MKSDNMWYMKVSLITYFEVLRMEAACIAAKLSLIMDG